MNDEKVNILTILPGFINTNIAKNAVGVSDEMLKTSQNNLGLSPDFFSKQALDAIFKRKKNIYIGGFKERAAMFLKRLSPAHVCASVPHVHLSVPHICTVVAGLALA